MLSVMWVQDSLDSMRQKDGKEDPLTISSKAFSRREVQGQSCGMEVNLGQ